jgi:hypothetical protein
MAAGNPARWSAMNLNLVATFFPSGYGIVGYQVFRHRARIGPGNHRLAHSKQRDVDAAAPP